MSIKIVAFHCKDKHIEQWDRRESPGADYTYLDNWYFTKVPRQFCGERLVFSTNEAGSIEYHIFLKNDLDLKLTLGTKINLK